MKTTMILLALVFSSSFAFAHDVPMAIYHITESDNSYEIKISFDLEDFSTSLGVAIEDVNIEIIESYLQENMSFQFNTKASLLDIIEFEIVRDHIHLKGILEKVVEKVETLKIENHCFINISKHSNIIQVELNSKSRDFRMNKKRTEINVMY